MSTIDPNLIDPTKPTEGEALTADVRLNETGTKTNFEAAVVDIDGLEAAKADRAAPATLDNVASLEADGDAKDSGIPAAQVARLDVAYPTQTFTAEQRLATGSNAASPWYVFGAAPVRDLILDGVTSPTARIREVYDGTDYRTAVTDQTGAVTRFLVRHSPEDGPTGGSQIGSPVGGYQGVGTLNASGFYVDGVELTSSAFTVTSSLNTTENALQIGSGTFDRGIASLGQGTSGHVLISAGTGAPPAFALVDSGNIADNAVGNLKLSDMPANSIKLRQTGVGDPSDTQISALPPVLTPGAGDFLLAESSLGLLSRVDVSNLPTGGGGEANTQSNQGAGVEIGLAKSGIDLPLRTLDTGQFELNGDQVRIPAGTFLSAVVDDTAPVLGGDMVTKGSEILLTRADDSVHGALLAQTAVDGALLAYTDTAGTYDSTNGAVEVGPGHVNLGGSAARVVALKHASSARMQVYADQGGGLYTVQEPAPGWTVEDTDTADYDLGAPGTGTGAWVPMTTLTVATGGDLEIGDRYDIAVTLTISNKTTNRSGEVEIYYSVNGEVPGALDVDDRANVAPGFAGQLTLGGFDLATVAYPSGTNVTIYARAANGSGVGYGLDLLGTIAPHRLLLSVPGGGAGGGIGVGSPFVVGDLLAVESATAGSETAETVGFGPSDIALLGAANTFSNANTFQAPITLTNTLSIDFGNAIDLANDVGTQNGAIRSTGVQFDILGTSDGFAADRLLTLAGSSVRAQRGADPAYDVLFPEDQTFAGATVAMDSATSPVVLVTLDGAVTVTAPTSGEGSWELIFTAANQNNVTPSGFTFADAASPAGQGSVAYVRRTSTGVTIFRFGGGTTLS